MTGILKNQHASNFIALLISATAAILAPLQTFIFVYAFIGPLHYLTEIVWLRKKNFYSADGIIGAPLYVFAATILGITVSADFYFHRGLTLYSIVLLVLLSLGTRIRNPLLMMAAIAALVIARFSVHGFGIFFTAILPTIVHVFFFTLLFMISGLVREKKRSLFGWVNPFLLAILPAFLLTLRRQYASPGPYWITAERGFASLHGYFVHLLGSNLHPDTSILADPAAAGVLRILAFIYLFHYLNWFAKTELLQWHRVSRGSWAFILSLYALSVGAYLWNFTVGLYLVNFLSLLHVFLEFPLNWHTGEFLSISFRHLWQRHDAAPRPV